jgi:hypothetical protein
LARFEPASGRPRRPPQAKTTMTLKGDDRQHDAYRKKKAAQYKEPRALTEDELAEAQAREIAEKRAAKAHVPLAAINRGDFGEGNREREQQEADTAALQRRKHKKEARAEKRAARRAARDEKKAAEYEASKKAFARQRSESLEGASPKSKAKSAKTDDSYLGGFFRSLSSLVGVEA